MSVALHTSCSGCHVFLLIIGCLLCSSRPFDASAQAASAEQAKALLISRLPDSPEAPEFRVNANSSTTIAPLLPEEMQALISKGEWESTARKRLSFVWRYDDDWEMKSAEAEVAKTDDHGALVPWPAQRDRFPFRPDIIERTAVGASAAPILWNHSISVARDQYFEAEATVSQYLQAKLERRIQLSIVREFPFSDEGAESKIVFRERTQLLTPPSIRGLSWLTFRFIGLDEDAVWILSPVTGKVRQVTETNRGDSMFSGFVAVRDLLGYGGKVERGASTLLGSEEFLVPIGAAEVLSAELLSDGCYRVRMDQTGHSPAAPRLTSKSTVMVPRRLLAVEVLSTDPFATHAREVVYFDSSTFLPAYRAVFNQSAELVRFIATAYALASSSDKKFRRAIVTQQLVWEPASDRVNSISVDRQRLCPPGSTPADRTALSPRSLVMPQSDAAL